MNPIDNSVLPKLLFEIKAVFEVLSPLILLSAIASGWIVVTSSPSSFFKSFVIAFLTMHSSPTFGLPSIIVRSSRIECPAKQIASAMLKDVTYRTRQIHPYIQFICDVGRCTAVWFFKILRNAFHWSLKFYCDDSFQGLQRRPRT